VKHGSNIMSETKSKYSGLETREVKSLSEKDIEIIRKGRGGIFGGMAILAELNHHPGPIHVLELGEQLDITDDQRKQTQDIYDEMEKDAKEIGEEFIKIEKMIDDGFANQDISDQQLQEYLKKSGELWGKLRFTHLRCHLATRKILNLEQIRQYDILRGYSHS
jgi:hypothetical protein